jgi:hypothetical protein
MALKRAVACDSVKLLGFSDPRKYDAGVINDARGSVSFPAGVSMKVCVGTGVHDFSVLKVKSEHVPAAIEVLADCLPGVGLTIEYTEGRDGRPPELVSVALENGPKSVKSPAAA